MSLRRIITDDKNLQLIQDNVSQAFRESDAQPMSQGVLISNVALTSGQDNPVSHGLRSTPTRWVILDVNAQATIWRTAWDEANLTLHTSANCTVSVWVR
jgi:hypothetical protein